MFSKITFLFAYICRCRLIEFAAISLNLLLEFLPQFLW
jgi:hypothetical protein